MFDMFKEELEKLSSTQQHKMIERFMRMIGIEGNGTSSGNLKVGQVVHVEFIGQGSVLNEPHFAVVWKCYSGSDSVVVIPLSKSGSNNYNIGKVPDLNGRDSYIKINQLHTVTTKAFTTDIVTLDNPTPRTVYLDTQQLNRVNDLFHFTHINEKNLLYILLHEVGKLVPTSFTLTNIQDLNRPITYSINGDKLLYKIWDDAKHKELLLTDLKIPSNERRNLLTQLFNVNPSVRSIALRTIEERIEELKRDKLGGDASA